MSKQLASSSSSSKQQPLAARLFFLKLKKVQVQVAERAIQIQMIQVYLSVLSIAQIAQLSPPPNKPLQVNSALLVSGILMPAVTPCSSMDLSSQSG
jgi:hypothetical protein